jgi:hypothetical protein
MNSALTRGLVLVALLLMSSCDSTEGGSSSSSDSGAGAGSSSSDDCEETQGRGDYYCECRCGDRVINPVGFAGCGSDYQGKACDPNGESGGAGGGTGEGGPGNTDGAKWECEVTSVICDDLA